MKKKLVAVLLVFFVFTGVWSGAQAKSAFFTADVHSDSMPCYSRRIDSDEYYLGSLDKGTVVFVLSFSRGWAKIEYKGRVGYAHTSDMASHKRAVGYILDDADGYEEASDFSPYMGTIKKTTKVYVVGVKDGFLLVENKSGSIRTYVEQGKVVKYPVVYAMS